MRFPPSPLRKVPARRPPRASARAVLAAGLLAAACLPTACALDEEDQGDWFSLEADSALTAYARVVVALEDTAGQPRATLFDDSLTSVARLRRLPARDYRGGLARIVLRGYRGGVLRYRETRLYDGDAQKVLSVTIELDPAPGAALPDPYASRPPAVSARPADTVISIRDSVTFRIEADDPDGDLAGFGLDCDGDGAFEDTGSLAGPRALVARGRRYADTGSYACLLEARDRAGRPARLPLRVRVVLDPPVAEAGPDTTVEAGSTVRLTARGRDGFGPIVTREWKVGDKPFQSIPAMDFSFQAPAGAGTVPCILRVTDTDKLIGLDTLLVHVIPLTVAP